MPTPPTATTAGFLGAIPAPRGSRPARPEPVPETATVDPAVDRLLERPVFILTSVRSGSTLLRMMLGAHPRLHAAHELHLTGIEVYFKSGTPTERSLRTLGLGHEQLEGLLWDRALHRELVKSGKQFIVEKTPGNAFHGAASPRPGPTRASSSCGGTRARWPVPGTRPYPTGPARRRPNVS
ncbi:sulfotransferase [Streptomyces sp. NPDC088350]|uniref:sulfotransferase n=1 Tax=Streptomyces sp. NPDC088350 TaxID=3365854 RepID=UPI003811E90C